jgi:hypothetical protein
MSGEARRAASNGGTVEDDAPAVGVPIDAPRLRER